MAIGSHKWPKGKLVKPEIEIHRAAWMPQKNTPQGVTHGKELVYGN
jgi:hypothetical protein